MKTKISAVLITALFFSCHAVSFGGDLSSKETQKDKKTNLINRMNIEIKKGYKVRFCASIGEYDDLILAFRSPFGIGATMRFDNEVDIGDGLTIIGDPDDQLIIETVLVNLGAKEVSYPRRKSGRGMVLSQKYKEITVVGFIPFSVGDIIYPIMDEAGIRQEPSVEARFVGGVNKGTSLEVLKIEGKWIRVKTTKLEGWIPLMVVSPTQF